MLDFNLDETSSDDVSDDSGPTNTYYDLEVCSYFCVVTVADLILSYCSCVY